MVDIIYKCQCGKEFSSYRSLFSHGAHCSLYIKQPKYNINISKYKKDNLYICECGYTTDNYLSLNGHFAHCFKHRELLGKDTTDSYWNIRNHVGKMSGWDNKSEDEILEIHRKASNTLKDRYMSGELVSNFKGKTHTPEAKKVMLEKAVLRYLRGDSPAHINGHMTYIEKWFVTEILEKYNVLESFDVVSEYCEKPYFLDFAFPMLKVGFETDGMFHVYDPKHIEHDKKRDAYLRSIGWTIYRFNYDQIKKDTENTVNAIMNIINSLKPIKIGESVLYKYKEYKNLLLSTPVGELVLPLD